MNSRNVSFKDHLVLEPLVTSRTCKGEVEGVDFPDMRVVRAEHVKGLGEKEYISFSLFFFIMDMNIT